MPMTTWIDEAKAMLIPGLEAAGVVGTMPNIPANRINTQLDYRGPSHTISAEELSGLRALEVAVDALAKGEIRAALVGAVDLSVEPAHEHAAEQLLPEDRQIAGDAAVVLLLKRLDDAERDGDNVLAILDDAASSADASCPSECNPLFLGLAADHAGADDSLWPRPCGFRPATRGRGSHRPARAYASRGRRGRCSPAALRPGWLLGRGAPT